MSETIIRTLRLVPYAFSLLLALLFVSRDTERHALYVCVTYVCVHMYVFHSLPSRRRASIVSAVRKNIYYRHFIDMLPTCPKSHAAPYVANR